MSRLVGQSQNFETDFLQCHFSKTGHFSVTKAHDQQSKHGLSRYKINLCSKKLINYGFYQSKKKKLNSKIHT